MAGSTQIRVSETNEGQNVDKAKDIPAHWVDDKPSAFRNPWPSWRAHGPRDMLNLTRAITLGLPAIPKDLDTLIPVRKPTWGLQDKESDSTSHSGELKATWLGHACFLVEFPARTATGSTPPSRGARILFDPVFSDRCSPVQFMGPKRFTRPPCDAEEIPEVDAIIISHNHYDHLDTATIRALWQRSRKPHIFAPLGNGPYFRHLGIAESHIHIMDWWQSKHVEIEIPAAASTAGKEVLEVAFDVTCTPCQHFTGRGLFDRFKSLWASWAVVEARPRSSYSPEDLEGYFPGKPMKVFFAGDTGYRAVRDGMDEEHVPTCPAFSEIGDRFGGFDFAMIPIGAYLPRDFMSPVHCAPQDSVRLFQDIRAKRALGMHWGTWTLTTEEVTEPPKRLAEECKKAGIEEDAFQVCEIGETMFI